MDPKYKEKKKKEKSVFTLISNYPHSLMAGKGGARLQFKWTKLNPGQGSPVGTQKEF